MTVASVPKNIPLIEPNSTSTNNFMDMNMSNIKKVLFSVFIAMSLSSCQGASDNAQKEDINEIRFTNKAPIELNVGSIEVISEFTPSFRRPNVEHLFPVSIERTAKSWANDRLRAVDYSSDKTAYVIIKDASVVETLEESDKAFVKDRLKYRASLNVVLRVSDNAQQSSAQTELAAWRELSIPSDTPLEEKEKYWNGMVMKLFDEFDVRMEQNIRQYLNQYVKNNKVIREYN